MRSRGSRPGLSVLVGTPGPGKTSVVGALIADEVLRSGGVLLLAPTGKARVSLQRGTGGDARTVAQFLHSVERYDGSDSACASRGDTYRRSERS